MDWHCQQSQFPCKRLPLYDSVLQVCLSETVLRVLFLGEFGMSCFFSGAQSSADVWCILVCPVCMQVYFVALLRVFLGEFGMLCLFSDAQSPAVGCLYGVLHISLTDP